MQKTEEASVFNVFYPLVKVSLSFKYCQEEKKDEETGCPTRPVTVPLVRRR